MCSYYSDSLLSAIASADIKKVKKMLEKFENNAYIVNNKGSCYYPPCYCDLHVYPLGFACAISNLEVVKCLVENGANIKGKFKNSVTALMYATLKGLAKGGNLVENGTDISAEDKNGITATLIIALMFASAKGDLEVTKYLVEKGANINAKDKNGKTALMHASVKGHLEVVKYLAELGADINAKDKDGKTALIMSSENGKLEIVKYLEKKLELDNEVKTYLNQCLERIKEIKNMIKEFDYSDRKSYIDEILDIEDNINKEFVELNVDKTNEIIDRVNEIYKNAYKRKNNISSLSYIMNIIETEEQISLINNIDINDLK